MIIIVLNVKHTQSIKNIRLPVLISYSKILYDAMVDFAAVTGSSVLGHCVHLLWLLSALAIVIQEVHK